VTGTEVWAQLHPDEAGLVTAVVQHATDRRVLMVGHMNDEALAATLETGFVTFFSRSRATLWKKGESSGHVLHLRGLRIDCDGDALLVDAIPAGPTCHTLASSCFFRRNDRGKAQLATDDGPAATPSAVFDRVFDVILARQRGEGMTQAEGKSYVRSLLAGGADRVGAKLREEAGELHAAIAGESDDRVAAEAADLLFHTLVGLALRGIGPAEVARVLDARFGTSGIDEKASRP
jgi:phosphoribosyl-ATP pyrophosphohydrolase/phosphoribosyl-AMP cyclohydrolase